MLEMISFANISGLNPILVVLDRGEEQLIIDKSLLGYDIHRINVGYKEVDLRRLLSVPGIFRKLRKVITNKLEPNGTIVTSSFDMLFIARLLNIFHNYKIRHQVRDLHALQLGDGAFSWALRQLERSLLRRVEKIIVSSPKFSTEYYEKIYSGEIVLLENVPQKSVWSEFTRRRRANGEFVIGYIGILRYKESLYKLIETTERLAKEGMKIRVVFAGGGRAVDIADVQSKISASGVFEFRGAYEYSKDIKRLYQDLDLIYAVYDENNRNCQIAMPNKFYESILSKIPILVAANTYVGEQTLAHGIGEVVSLSDANNLYHLLRTAAEPNSWHARASNKLQRMSPDIFYARHEQAMAKSVL